MNKQFHSSLRVKSALRVLADRAVELELVDIVSHEGIRKLLKNELKPHLKKMWCIGRITPEFIWRMEDVLNQHELPYDPKPGACRNSGTK